MNPRVLCITSKNEWRDALNQIGHFDFVHTYDFHLLGEMNGEGAPVLFVLIEDREKVMACWPALRRQIEGTAFFDLTSVYGYGGPLFREGVDVISSINCIWKAMHDEGAITLFSRMHPLYVEEINNNDMRGQKLSDVVLIDVHASPRGLSAYRGSHRREIQNAKKRGVQVFVDMDCHKISDFYKIYNETMRYLNASEYYYFNSKYFDCLKKSDDFKTILIYAELDGIVIAASLFILTNTVMQYFLSGTLASYRKLAPSKLIIAKAHELAINSGIDKIILGGGVGSARDALFEFKAGFSQVVKPFYVTRKIFHEDIYLKICCEKFVNPNKTSFFPAYRASIGVNSC